jgi:DNA-3-methyladenine glycosylase I
MNSITEDKQRCGWCLSSELYKEYHDQEWGIPVYDDTTLFEVLPLETFQAGLSWITILNKREHFRTAFDQFDYKKIASYNDDKILDLLQDPGIIRNKLKVYSAVTNAQNFIKIQEEFGSISAYIWKFTSNKPLINNP